MTCHIVCQQIDCVSRCNRTVNHTIVLLVYVCKKIITFVDINVLLIDFFMGKCVIRLYIAYVVIRRFVSTICILFLWHCTVN